jgi:hypothetical protein
MLPLVLFPALNVKNLDDTAALYGQTIFFFIWGTTLVGHAMKALAHYIFSCCR